MSSIRKSKASNRQRGRSLILKDLSNDKRNEIEKIVPEFLSSTNSIDQSKTPSSLTSLSLLNSSISSLSTSSPASVSLHRSHPPANCSHVTTIQPDQIYATLEKPDKWKCIDCETSNSIRLCLSCGDCYCSSHLILHFSLSRHPCFLHLNSEQKNVYCFVCKCRVINDNRKGEIALIKQKAEAIQTLSLQPRRTRSGKLIADPPLMLRRFSTIDMEEIEEQLSGDQTRLQLDNNNTSNGFQLPYLSAKMIDKRSKEDIECTLLYRWKMRMMKAIFLAWKSHNERHRHQNLTSTEKSNEEEQSDRKEIIQDKEQVEEKNQTLHMKVKYPSDGIKNINDESISPRKRRSIENCIENEENPADRNIKRRLEPISTSLTSTPSDHTTLTAYHPLPSVTPLPREDLRPTKISSISKRSTHHIPLIIFPRLKDQPGCCGLRNLGNTCYLNSVVQAISHTLAIRDLLIKYWSNLNEKDKAEFKNNVNTSIPPSLSLTMGELLSVLWSGKRVQTTPDHFLQTVWKLYSSFKGFKQQDAQEFMLFVMDQLAKEQNNLNTASNRDKRKSISQGNTSDLISPLFSGSLISSVECMVCRNISESVNVTSSMLSIQIPPESCKLGIDDSLKVFDSGASQSNEPSMEINSKSSKRSMEGDLLSVPDSNKRSRNIGRISGGSTSANSSPYPSPFFSPAVPQTASSMDALPSFSLSTSTAGRPQSPNLSAVSLRHKVHHIPLSLIDLLIYNFLTPDALTHPPSYNCPICKKITPAQKRTQLNSKQMPKYLVLHIIRTIYDASTGSSSSKFDNMSNGVSTGGVRKDQTHVAFPLTGLDLSPFVTTTKKEREEELENKCHDQLDNNNNNNNNNDNNNCGYPSNPPLIYDLYSVVSHHGRGMNEGHFTNYTYHHNLGIWLLLNDTRVSQTSDSVVGKAQAYMLYYERREEGDVSRKDESTKSTNTDQSTMDNDGDGNGENDSDGDNEGLDNISNNVEDDLNLVSSDFMNSGRKMRNAARLSLHARHQQ